MKERKTPAPVRSYSPAGRSSPRKKAASRASSFIDRRPCISRLATLQAKIDRSPRLTQQRQQVMRLSKPTRLHPSSIAPAQRTPIAHGATVTQRDPGDESLVENIRAKSRVAKDAYSLLETQAETAVCQVEMLEFYAAPVQNEQNEELNAAQTRIEKTGQDVQNQIKELPKKAHKAYAEVLARANLADMTTSHQVLDQWVKELPDYLAIVLLAQAEAQNSLVTIKNEAIKMAHIAMAEREPHMMRGLLKVADESDAAIKEPQPAPELTGKNMVSSSWKDTGSSSRKEKLGLATTIGDALNNATTGVGFGAVSALDVGGAINLSTTAATTTGILGGLLGIFFGAIGTSLGVKNAVLGAQKRKALKNAKSLLSNRELEEIAEYAIEQKGTKTKRNTAAAAGGLLAVGAGAVGLVALSVASFGIPALVAGIAAALVGLGFVAFRLIHHWRKRKAERRAFADELIDQIQNHGENREEAKRIISSVGLDPAKVDQSGFRKDLISKVGKYVASKRTQMAQGLVRSLIVGKPSEVFDAELILQALGIAPEWVRAKIAQDKVNKAVDRVAGKLASW